MAFTYGFYNSLDGDRKYNANQISAIFDGIIYDGVYASIENKFAVLPGTGMQVLVDTGRAWFNHTWNYNNALYPVSIPAADVTLSRYHAIVIEVNSNDSVRTNKITIVSGSLGSSPAKPTMTKSDKINQWPLAYVLVGPNATSITKSNITIAVGTSECPYVSGILSTVNVDILFQQWEGQFSDWWANIKAVLNDNVVTALQNNIDKCVKIADLATQNEAVTGTNNTKWMSPLQVKNAIGTSGDTVKDLTTGEKVSIRTRISEYGLSGISFLPTGLTMATRTAPVFCYNPTQSKMFVVYKKNSDGYIYVGYFSTSSAGEKTITELAQINNNGNGFNDDGGSFVKFFQVGGQIDGNIVGIQHMTLSGTYTNFLLNTKTNNLSAGANGSAIGSSYPEDRFFSTTNYWGGGNWTYPTTSVFYKAHGNGGSFSNVSLNTPTGCIPIGVYSDTLYFLEPDALNYPTLYKLGKIVFSASPTITQGLDTYNFTAKSWANATAGQNRLAAVFQDSRYIYLSVSAYINAYLISATLLKIDMIDGSSNWASIPIPVNSGINAAPYNAGTAAAGNKIAYYGTVGTSAYALIDMHSLLQINKSTGALSVSSLSASMTQFITPGRFERTFDIPLLSGKIPHGACLLDVNTSVVDPLVSYSQLQGFVASYAQMCARNYHRVSAETPNYSILNYLEVPIIIGNQFNSRTILGGTTRVSKDSIYLWRFVGGDLTYETYVTKT